MINVSNKVFVYVFSALFFIAAGCFAYWQEIYFLLIPLALAAAIFLVQHPEYLFYLLMLSIPWSIEFNFSSNFGTDLPDEPFMLLSALAVIFCLIYYRKNFHWRKLHPLLLILAIQFLWIIVTVIPSFNFFLSVKYLLAKSWYLLAFVVLPLFLFKEERIFKRAVILLLSSMMIATIVALTRHAMDGFSFEEINNSLHPFFRNHVNYSALLVFMVPLLIALIQLSIVKKLKAFLICILIIAIAAVYFSYARGAWIALIAGILAYWLLRKRLLFFGFILGVSMIVATVFWLQSNNRFIKLSNDYKSTIFHTSFREHLIATYELKDLSNAERIYRWVAGVRMIGDSWKTGFGPSTFYDQYKSYTLPAFKTYVSNNQEHSTVHNYFLLLLIEQGVMGCLLFVMLIAALFWYVQTIYFRTKEKFWRVVIAATASILVMECVVNFLSDMIETDKVGSVFYLCVSTIIIADIKTRKSNPAANVERIS